MLRLLAVLALCLAVANAQGNCSSIVGEGQFDVWCNATCNHEPPNCPPSVCTCEGGLPPANQCVATGLYAFLGNQWCTINCNHDPPFCPPFCDCDGVQAAPINQLTFEPHDPTCCFEDDHVLFFASGPEIFKVTNNGEPELCYTGVGQPSSIVIDSEDNMYVADPLLGTVSRMSVDCDNTTVVVLTSWIRDGEVDRPTGLLIAPDGIIVTGTTGAYQMIFNGDGTVFDVVPISFNGSIYHLRDGLIHDGFVYYVSRDAMIIKMDLSTGVVTPFIAIHELDIPDYGGMTINDCGLYFTATDSNRVFFCPDLTNSSSCVLYCNPDDDLDGFSCVNINNPVGMASGCCCDIYVTNPGNGCIVSYNNTGVFSLDPNFDIDGPFDAEIVACNLTHPQTVTFYNPPRADPTCTNVCLETPAPSPSPTSSPSPSPTPSSTFVGSPTASATISVSTSPTASPSPSFSRRLARIVPGLQLQGAGGVDTAAVLVGTVNLSLILCEPGEPRSRCARAEDLSNSYHIPVNLIDVVNQPGDPPRSEITPLFLQAAGLANFGFTGTFEVPCLVHVAPLLREGGVEIDCSDPVCFGDRSRATIRLLSNDLCSTSNDPDAARERTRAALTAAAVRLNESFVATEVTFGDTLFQVANTDMCDGDMVAEYSVSLMQNPVDQSVQITLATQPRFDTADRCTVRGETIPAQRACFDAAPFFDSHFNGTTFGEGGGTISCIEDFLVNESFFTPTGFALGYQVADSIMQMALGDVIDLGFNVQSRSTSCPLGVPASMCAPDPNRICYLDECSP